MPPRLELLAELTGHLDRVWQVSWHPSGKTLASCGGDKTIRLWSCSSEKDDTQDSTDDAQSSTDDTPRGSSKVSSRRWRCCQVLEGAHKRTIRSVNFSPDGRCLASASFDATTGIWEREEGGSTADFECVATLEGHENEAKSVAWSASGNLIATCSRDKSVWIWEAEEDNDFECLSVLQEHSQDVKMVAWHPHEELLASASYDDTIKMWAEDDDDWYCVDTLVGHRSTVWCINFDGSGENLVSCGDDRSMRFWRRYKPGNAEGVPTRDSRTPTWKLVTTLENAHDRCIYSASWSRHHDRVASVGGDATINIFAAAPSPPPPPTTTSEKEVTVGWENILSHERPHGASDVNSVSWNPHPDMADVLATGADDGMVRIWKFVP